MFFLASTKSYMQKKEKSKFLPLKKLKNFVGLPEKNEN